MSLLSLIVRFWILILQTAAIAVVFLWNLSIQMTVAVLSLVVRKRRVVGIFSREGEESYRFLTQALRGRPVGEVRTSTITNNGWQKFHEDLSGCDFAILYHSKNRGRVNITNVTDSIYDEELKYLSNTLGKENVLVVVDDLDSTTPDDKQKILSSQTLIPEKARDLFLFNKDKNTYREETVKKIEGILCYINNTTHHHQ